MRRGLEGRTAIVDRRRHVDRPGRRARVPRGRSERRRRRHRRRRRRAPSPATLGERVLFAATDIRDDAQIARVVVGDRRRDSAASTSSSTSPAPTSTKAPRSPRADWLESLDVNVVSAAMMAKRRAAAHGRARAAARSSTSRSISAKVAQTGRWLYPVGEGGARPADTQHGDGPRRATASASTRSRRAGRGRR